MEAYFGLSKVVVCLLDYAGCEQNRHESGAGRFWRRDASIGQKLMHLWNAGESRSPFFSYMRSLPLGSHRLLRGTRHPQPRRPRGR